jgi:hypothetical protein
MTDGFEEDAMNNRRKTANMPVCLVGAAVALSFFATSCGSGNSAPLPPRAISLSFLTAPPPSLLVNGTATLAAVVSNDPPNAGVNWSVTCNSASACGSFDSPHTASGGATTYTASPAVPPGNTVTVIATSTAESTKSVSASITIYSAPLMISSGQTLPAGNVGSNYGGNNSIGAWISATGGVPPYTWSWTAAAGSSMPPGLKFANVCWKPFADNIITSLLISGVPTMSGTFSVVTTVTDSAGTKASAMISIIIDTSSPVTIAPGKSLGNSKVCSRRQGVHGADRGTTSHYTGVVSIAAAREK